VLGIECRSDCVRVENPNDVSLCWFIGASAEGRKSWPTESVLPKEDSYRCKSDDGGTLESRPDSGCPIDGNCPVVHLLVLPIVTKLGPDLWYLLYAPHHLLIFLNWELLKI